TTCSDRSMQLTFLDGASGAVLDGPIPVPDLSPAGPFLASPVDLAWTEDDTFAVGYWGSSPTPDTNLAAVFGVGEAPQTGVEMAIDCFYPPTSSSYTGASGDSVSIDSDSGTLSVTNSGAPPLTFGCP
ncbi:MAG: hypothetical protein VX498_13915, partial [Myxococcota bacterium]|nr:hypothetical protein [Myxococcota bacterium]